MAEGTSRVDTGPTQEKEVFECTQIAKYIFMGSAKANMSKYKDELLTTLKRQRDELQGQIDGIKKESDDYWAEHDRLSKEEKQKRDTWREIGAILEKMRKKTIEELLPIMKRIEELENTHNDAPSGPSEGPAKSDRRLVSPYTVTTYGS